MSKQVLWVPKTLHGEFFYRMIRGSRRSAWEVLIMGKGWSEQWARERLDSARRKLRRKGYRVVKVELREIE